MLHDTPVLALAPSPDGALLASGDKGGGIKVWRVATGVLLLRLVSDEPGKGRVRCR